MRRGAVAGIVCTALLACAGRAAAASCESLATLELAHTTMTLANVVDAGTFRQLPLTRLPGYSVVPLPTLGFADLPAFCRVLATLMPSSDSDIKMELWMPVSGWNGNLWGNKGGTEVGKRPVCQYPRLATLKGQRNIEDPASYRCL
jgi:feruloyl esterase